MAPSAMTAAPAPTPPPTPAQGLPTGTTMLAEVNRLADTFVADPVGMLSIVGLGLGGGLAVLALGYLVLGWLRRSRRFALDAAASAHAGAEASMAQRLMQAAGPALWVGRLAIAALALGVTLELWGVPALRLATDSEGRALLARALTILGVIAAVPVLVAFGTQVIEAQLVRQSAEMSAQPGASGDGDGRRARTILVLLRRAFAFVLWTAAGLMVLAELGIDIAPLLAGAGVVGLAVGFGAQTLVRDFITGVFILIEDSVRVGDFVTIGNASGSVEALSLRTIQLRGVDGSLHVVPFSEVRAIQNQTRGFAFAVVDLPVPVSVPVARVEAVADAVLAVLATAPEAAGRMLAPPELLGIDRIEDVRYVVRIRVRTIPGEQWAIGRLILARLLEACAAAGISLEPTLTPFGSGRG